MSAWPKAVEAPPMKMPSTVLPGAREKLNPVSVTTLPPLVWKVVCKGSPLLS